MTDQPQVEPNDPEQEGESAELTDAQREQAEANATQGDQGPQVQEQDATRVGATTGGFDPNAPDRISPPAPDEQSGVPGVPENADVDPGTATPADNVANEAEGGTALDSRDEDEDEDGEGENA